MIYDKHSCFQDKIFDAVVLFLLVGAFILTAYPLFFVVIASISDPDYVNAGEVFLYPKGFSLRSYEFVMQDSRIMTGYMNTIIYTVFGTLVSVIVTVCAAFSLSRKELLFHKFFTWFFLFTMYFGGGLIPTYLQVRDLGLTNTRGAMILVGAVGIWNLIVCRTFFKNTMPDELWEAASIDGCGMLRFFYKIVIPNAKPIIAIMVLYYAVGQWNEFFKALIYISRSELYPLQLILRDMLLASQTLSIDADPELIIEMTKQAESMKYAMIVVSSLPVLALYPFVQKFFVKGMMVGSVKG